MRYQDLGLLVNLVSGMRDLAQDPDILLLNQAISAAPWAAQTLDALVNHSSLRLASAALFTHHSTMQARVSKLEQTLPWALQTPAGKLRLHLAMSGRRYLMHPVESGAVCTAVRPFVSLI